MIKYKSINQAHVKSSQEYLKDYNESLNNNDKFWSEKPPILIGTGSGTRCQIMILIKQKFAGTKEVN